MTIKQFRKIHPGATRKKFKKARPTVFDRHTEYKPMVYSPAAIKFVLERHGKIFDLRGDGDIFDSDSLTRCSNFRVELAEHDHYCNASTFIQDVVDEIWPDLTKEQQAAVNRAQANNWMVKAGTRCRHYTWDAGRDEEMECIEIPEISEIVSELDMWTN